MTTIDVYSQGPEFAPETPHFSTTPEDTDSRRLLVLLLDVSGSMGATDAARNGQRPIDELNTAFRKFLRPDGIQKSSFGLNGEVAIAAFYSTSESNRVTWLPLGVRVHENSDIHWARFVRPFDKDLVAYGGTPLGTAVCAALDLIERRIQEWDRENIVPNPRPVLLILTDGRPTDSITQATARLHAMENDHHLLAWVACTHSADVSHLAPMANKGNLVPLGDKAISAFIQLVSASLEISTTSPRRSAADIYAQLNAKWTKDPG